MSQEPAPAPRAKPAPKRSETARLVIGVVIAILITLFAVLNTEDVKVNWIFWTSRSPLIVVILVSAVFGILFGRLFTIVRRRSRRARAGGR